MTMDEMANNFYSKRMWDVLSTQINNPHGTAGLVGALYFASEWSPDFGWKENYESIINETKLTKKTLMDVNGDFRKLFIHDKKPFGIAGWNTWYRKQSLINYAAKEDRPLLALDIQLAFLLDELDSLSYGHVLEGLKKAENAEDAARLVFDGYLDLNRKTRSIEDREQCAYAADIAYKMFATSTTTRRIPVKYVTTDLDNVKVYRKPKYSKKSGLRLLRRNYGKMVVNELYPLLGEIEENSEYAILFDEKEGYVPMDQTHVFLRMVEEK